MGRKSGGSGNAWNDFQRAHAGEGLSRSEAAAMYRAATTASFGNSGGGGGGYNEHNAKPKSTMTAWNAFQHEYGGRGLSKSDISRLYALEKTREREPSMTGTTASSTATEPTRNPPSDDRTTWNTFQNQYGGKGLSKAQIADLYQQYKAARDLLDSATLEAQRRSQRAPPTVANPFGTAGGYTDTDSSDGFSTPLIPPRHNIAPSIQPTGTSPFALNGGFGAAPKGPVPQPTRTRRNVFGGHEVQTPAPVATSSTTTTTSGRSFFAGGFGRTETSAAAALPAPPPSFGGGCFGAGGTTSTGGFGIGTGVFGTRVTSETSTGQPPPPTPFGGFYYGTGVPTTTPPPSSGAFSFGTTAAAPTQTNATTTTTNDTFSFGARAAFGTTAATPQRTTTTSTFSFGTAPAEANQAHYLGFGALACGDVRLPTPTFAMPVTSTASFQDPYAFGQRVQPARTTAPTAFPGHDGFKFGFGIAFDGPQPPPRQRQEHVADELGPTCLQHFQDATGYERSPEELRVIYKLGKHAADATRPAPNSNLRKQVRFAVATRSSDDAPPFDASATVQQAEREKEKEEVPIESKDEKQKQGSTIADEPRSQTPAPATLDESSVKTAVDKGPEITAAADVTPVRNREEPSRATDTATILDETKPPDIEANASRDVIPDPSKSKDGKTTTSCLYRESGPCLHRASSKEENEALGKQELTDASTVDIRSP